MPTPPNHRGNARNRAMDRTPIRLVRHSSAVLGVSLGRINTKRAGSATKRLLPDLKATSPTLLATLTATVAKSPRLPLLLISVWKLSPLLRTRLRATTHMQLETSVCRTSEKVNLHFQNLNPIGGHGQGPWLAVCGSQIKQCHKDLALVTHQPCGRLSSDGLSTGRNELC